MDYYKKRDKSIDIAKGIGIILVVYGHMNCPIKNEIYLFHMPLFFFLSGYFFSAKDTIKPFLKKKIKAILFPAIFFYILSFFIIYSIGDHNNLKEYIQSFTYFLDPNGVIWFLIALFQIFIISYFVERYIQNSLIKIFIVLFFTGIGYLMSIYKIFFLYFPQACLGLIFFYTGLIIRKTNSMERLNDNKYVFLCALLCYLAGVVLNVHTDMSPLVIDKSFILFFLPALGGTVLILFFSKFLQKYNQINWLAFIGKNSLMVMCLHMPLSSVLYVCFFDSGGHFAENQEYTNIRTLSFLVLSVSFSLFIGIVIKRIFPYIFDNK